MFRDGCKRFLRFWAPSGLIEAYRLWRGGPSSRLFPWRDNYPQLAKVRVEELFPGIDSLAVNIPLNAVSGEDEWALPPRELAVLGAICIYSRPQRVFEIGTYKGASTSAIALDTPETTEVFTIDPLRLDATPMLVTKRWIPVVLPMAYMCSILCILNLQGESR